MKICKQAGCEQPVHCWGLCNRHRLQLSTERKRVNPCACGCGALVQYSFAAGHRTRTFTPEEQSRRGRMNNGDKQRDRGAKDWYRKVRGRHEHRVVAERTLGRKLLFTDVVHHIDGNKKNNAPENLQVLTRAEHIAEHRHELIAGRKRAAT